MKLSAYQNYLFLILTLLLTQKIYSQKIIPVNPGYGTLNAAIENEESNHSREELSNTIFTLERDGFYITTGTLENVAYKLNVWSADGPGARPIIKPGVDQGGLSVNSFTPRGDLYLKGLSIRNVDILGSVLGDCVVGRSDSLNIVFEDCHFDSTATSFIRMDVDWLNIKAIDCIFSNSNGAYNGSRLYDTRKNNVDSILIQNCTIYNIASYPSRGTSSGGAINFIKWDHNTIYNVSRKMGGVGQTIDSYFTNNLFINMAIMGKDSLGTYLPHPQYEGDIFLTIRELNNIYAVGKEQNLYFHHNNFFNDPAYIEAIPEGVTYPIPYFENYGWEKFYENNSLETWYEIDVEFEHPPLVVPEHVSLLWSLTDDNQDGSVGEDVLGRFTNDGHPFDFSYPETNFCYTAAENGYPLGDLNWFPDKKSQWEAGEILTSIKNTEQQLPGKIELYQNYPNPFNPSTTISFYLNRSAVVNLSIYNMLGEKVGTLINDEIKNPGKHSIKWNVKNSIHNSVSTNIYFVKLKVDENSFMNKMIYLK
ncbi:MAG: T9SS type A sorting domain-containing protein [Candidatus Cloacimonetes bacterium]|nr:T9SS type A sorting domain-containing protein [Candidatus Cloacimonadota bacterium]